MEKQMTVTMAELVAVSNDKDVTEVLTELFNRVAEMRREAHKLTAKAQRERNREILEAGRKALGLEVKKSQR